ncbi:MAG: threonine synthase [Deltaproteobacteria bacterium]|jgi:threonine synthase|nr:threonine synthase [Deltaproteobacteria bacterium]
MRPCENVKNFPDYRGNLEYYCPDCAFRAGLADLLYACPACGTALLLRDLRFDELKKRGGAAWRELFDRRAAEKTPLARGIFRFYELMAPVLEEEDLIWLGEGQTPEVPASPALQKEIGLPFAYKNDGQNPSASFKDRGMACAFSYLRAKARTEGWDEALAVCASTGDTSAAAAMYAAYAGAPFKCAVLLPQGLVTAQQLAQPLGSGAAVMELPGVFDDCMKVVEALTRDYRVVLLNSKNAWRVLGQESFAYETAQWHDWRTEGLCVFVPIGNAGNISAVLSGFLKLRDLEIIPALPRVFGVQSAHADPVFRYYEHEGAAPFAPVRVKPSAAQAAMIGNPVSFPRVRHLAEKYRRLGGTDAFQVVRVTEQAIMDCMLTANRHGHIACTQGGESLAGLREALACGLMRPGEYAVLDSTAHMLKFADFQNRYFADAFTPEYAIKADRRLTNASLSLFSPEQKEAWGPEEYPRRAAEGIAKQLKLHKRG